jgi:predicted O-linked N-acetylglucosamine transferase (SPINDLY family)
MNALTADCDGVIADHVTPCRVPPQSALGQARRGIALLARNDAGGAITALQAAIDAGDASDATRLNLALAMEASGRTAEARALMRQVARHAPSWDEPYLRLAESFRRHDEMDAAFEAYQAALARDPNRVESLIGSGALLVMRGEGPPACDRLRRAATLAPRHPDAWDALGLALMLTKDTANARAAFAIAGRLAPHRFEIALHAAEAAAASGAAEAELARLEIAAQADPGNPLTLTVQGLLLEHLGRRAEAIDALEAAAALAPSAAIPLGVLGGMLARALRLAEAKAALQRAWRLEPDNVRVASDLGAVLMRMHQPAEACDLLGDLLDRIPPQLGILCNLANATAGCGRQDEAVALAREAIALSPDSPLSWRTLCGTLPYAESTDGRAMLEAAQACARRLPAAARPPAERTPGRRLRVGLLSGSFRVHPVGWLTVAGLETLDPDEFALVVFSQNSGTDPIARRFRAIAADWIDIDGLDDRAVADRILAARIDILIDLGGYGEGGRMAVCALRPAPVQVKWVGMQCHSTGLPAMDFFLSDRWETPPELERFYSERVWRLPDGYVCYSPSPHAPDVAPLPALRNGFVTFGCFNNLAKMTPRVLHTWAAILRRVPGARLVLKAPQFAHAPTATSVRDAIARHGVDPARVTTQGPSRHRAFLAEYGKIDIALWMGVPTITLPGEMFASRHSLSHLSNVGLADWAAGSIDDYIDQAVRRAADLPALAALRHGLRERVKASPLCDGPRFGRNLGAALRGMWAHLTAGQLS